MFKNLMLAAMVLFVAGCTTFNPGPNRDSPRAARESITVWLIGDSTMCDYSLHPQYREGFSLISGWGQEFQPLLSGDDLKALRPLIEASRAVVDDRAVGGRTTRSFFEEGKWRDVYNALQPGDMVFIQFGHNDAGIRIPEQNANRGIPEFVDQGYAEFLRLYVSQSREKGATPILLTPVARNYPWEEGKLTNVHGKFPDRVKQVVEEMDVLFIDLNQRSMDFFSARGKDYVSSHYFLNFAPGQVERYPEGIKDNTHFQKEGAQEVARLVYAGMKEIADEMNAE